MTQPGLWSEFQEDEGSGETSWTTSNYEFDSDDEEEQLRSGSAEHGAAVPPSDEVTVQTCIFDIGPRLFLNQAALQ